MIAAANVYTIKKLRSGPRHGLFADPAMSMVSYAAGARYLSLIGGVCHELLRLVLRPPPPSPQMWGEQTDVPESADWYNSTYLMVWGSNVPQTRTPDAHFYTEVRYKGTKTVAVSPDIRRDGQVRRHLAAPKQGTDAALAMAMGHVDAEGVPRRSPRTSSYFRDYVRQYTDMPMLVLLRDNDGTLVPDHFLRASRFR